MALKDIFYPSYDKLSVFIMAISLFLSLILGNYYIGLIAYIVITVILTTVVYFYRKADIFDAKMLAMAAVLSNFMAAFFLYKYYGFGASSILSSVNMIFAIWLGLLLKFDKIEISKTNPSFIAVLISLFIVYVIIGISFYYLKKPWELTYSICVLYSTIFSGWIANLFHLEKSEQETPQSQ